ncbi:SUF system Fe-S cluster assembly protein [bacterium]|nr:SUF system Fe-S cluster assembly protein [bacterium]
MANIDDISERVIATLRTIYDPEIPVNIFDLGLVYNVDVDPSGATHVRMTLTSPNCPVAESLPIEVRDKVGAVEGVTASDIEITWEPPWDPEMMSDAAKLELNMY